METERQRPVASASVDTGKHEILARSAFAGLPEPSRDALLAMAAVARLPRRAAIACEGEPPESLVLIGTGRVKVERRRGIELVTLGHRGPGHMVGETALAGAATATESASVVDDVEALAIPIAPLTKALVADAPLRAALAAAIVRQHRELEHRLIGLLLHSVEARLAAFVLDASDRWGAPRADGELVTAPFTHAEIAQLIGSTRETVTLVLGRLKRDGVIGFDRRRLVILDRARLAARAAAPTA